MKKLRNKTRVDRLQTEARGRRGRLGRWIYLILITLLLVWLFDVFLGKYLFFRADGMVMRDHLTKAVSYVADVRKLPVKEGDRVSEGDLLVRLSSLDLLVQLSTLDTKLADLQARHAELLSQLAQVDILIPLAKERATKMTVLRVNEERAITRGITGNRQMSEFLKDEFNAREKLEKLKGERQDLPLEISTMKEIIESLMETRQSLLEAYSEGKIIAEETLVVSHLYVTKGSALKRGEPIMDLLTGGSYVLAYVTPGSVNKIDVGDNVTIRYGIATAEGTITELYPISPRLPMEFQRTFRPQDRSQVIRIEFEENAVIPATFTKVNIVSAGVLPKWLSGLLN
ncbi:MAG: biotin/lipoyl-binding protein [Gammaproteobacteria bacterium]|nr:biotin/lipoyl-binding protein [Gammaproteobacteria bacterium]